MKSVNLSGADDKIAKQSSVERCTNPLSVRGFGSTYCYLAILFGQHTSSWTIEPVFSIPRHCLGRTRTTLSEVKDLQLAPKETLDALLLRQHIGIRRLVESHPPTVWILTLAIVDCRRQLQE
jgi:hypothetical protein